MEAKGTDRVTVDGVDIGSVQELYDSAPPAPDYDKIAERLRAIAKPGVTSNDVFKALFGS